MEHFGWLLQTESEVSDVFNIVQPPFNVRLIRIKLFLRFLKSQSKSLLTVLRFYLITMG